MSTKNAARSSKANVASAPLSRNGVDALAPRPHGGAQRALPPPGAGQAPLPVKGAVGGEEKPTSAANDREGNAVGLPQAPTTEGGGDPFISAAADAGQDTGRRSSRRSKPPLKISADFITDGNIYAEAPLSGPAARSPREGGGSNPAIGTPTLGRPPSAGAASSSAAGTPKHAHGESFHVKAVASRRSGTPTAAHQAGGGSGGAGGSRGHQPETVPAESEVFLDEKGKLRFACNSVKTLAWQCPVCPGPIIMLANNKARHLASERHKANERELEAMGGVPHPSARLRGTDAIHAAAAAAKLERLAKMGGGGGGGGGNGPLSGSHHHQHPLAAAAAHAAAGGAHSSHMAGSPSNIPAHNNQGAGYGHGGQDDHYSHGGDYTGGGNVLPGGGGGTFNGNFSNGGLRISVFETGSDFDHGVGGGAGVGGVGGGGAGSPNSLAGSPPASIIGITAARRNKPSGLANSGGGNNSSMCSPAVGNGSNGPSPGAGGLHRSNSFNGIGGGGGNGTVPRGGTANNTGAAGSSPAYNNGGGGKGSGKGGGGGGNSQSGNAGGDVSQIAGGGDQHQSSLLSVHQGGGGGVRGTFPERVSGGGGSSQFYHNNPDHPSAVAHRSRQAAAVREAERGAREHSREEAERVAAFYNFSHHRYGQQPPGGVAPPHADQDDDDISDELKRYGNQGQSPAAQGPTSVDGNAAAGSVAGTAVVGGGGKRSSSVTHMRSNSALGRSTSRQGKPAGVARAPSAVPRAPSVQDIATFDLNISFLVQAMESPAINETGPAEHASGGGGGCLDPASVASPGTARPAGGATSVVGSLKHRPGPATATAAADDDAHHPVHPSQHIPGAAEAAPPAAAAAAPPAQTNLAGASAGPCATQSAAATGQHAEGEAKVALQEEGPEEEAARPVAATTTTTATTPSPTAAISPAVETAAAAAAAPPPPHQHITAASGGTGSAFAATAVLGTAAQSAGSAAQQVAGRGSAASLSLDGGQGPPSLSTPSLSLSDHGNGAAGGEGGGGPLHPSSSLLQSQGKDCLAAASTTATTAATTTTTTTANTAGGDACLEGAAAKNHKNTPAFSAKGAGLKPVLRIMQQQQTFQSRAAAGSPLPLPSPFAQQAGGQSGQGGASIGNTVVNGGGSAGSGVGGLHKALHVHQIQSTSSSLKLQHLNSVQQVASLNDAQQHVEDQDQADMDAASSFADAAFTLEADEPAAAGAGAGGRQDETGAAAAGAQSFALQSGPAISTTRAASGCGEEQTDAGAAAPATSELGSAMLSINIAAQLSDIGVTQLEGPPPVSMSLLAASGADAIAARGGGAASVHPSDCPSPWPAAPPRTGPGAGPGAVSGGGGGAPTSTGKPGQASTNANNTAAAAAFRGFSNESNNAGGAGFAGARPPPLTAPSPYDRGGFNYATPTAGIGMSNTHPSVIPLLQQQQQLTSANTNGSGTPGSSAGGLSAAGAIAAGQGGGGGGGAGTLISPRYSMGSPAAHLAGYGGSPSRLQQQAQLHRATVQQHGRSGTPVGGGASSHNNNNNNNNNNNSHNAIDVFAAPDATAPGAGGTGAVSAGTTQPISAKPATRTLAVQGSTLHHRRANSNNNNGSGAAVGGGGVTEILIPQPGDMGDRGGDSSNNNEIIIPQPQAAESINAAAAAAAGTAAADGLPGSVCGNVTVEPGIRAGVAVIMSPREKDEQDLVLGALAGLAGQQQQLKQQQQQQQQQQEEGELRGSDDDCDGDGAQAEGVLGGATGGLGGASAGLSAGGAFHRLLAPAAGTGGVASNAQEFWPNGVDAGANSEGNGVRQEFWPNGQAKAAKIQVDACANSEGNYVFTSGGADNQAGNAAVSPPLHMPGGGHQAKDNRTHALNQQHAPPTQSFFLPAMSVASPSNRPWFCPVCPQNPCILAKNKARHLHSRAHLLAEEDSAKHQMQHSGGPVREPWRASAAAQAAAAHATSSANAAYQAAAAVNAANAALAAAVSQEEAEQQEEDHEVTAATMFCRRPALQQPNVAGGGGGGGGGGGAVLSTPSGKGVQATAAEEDEDASVEGEALEIASAKKPAVGGAAAGGAAHGAAGVGVVSDLSIGSPKHRPGTAAHEPPALLASAVKRKSAELSDDEAGACPVAMHASGTHHPPEAPCSSKRRMHADRFSQQHGVKSSTVTQQQEQGTDIAIDPHGALASASAAQVDVDGQQQQQQRDMLAERVTDRKASCGGVVLSGLHQQQQGTHSINSVFSPPIKLSSFAAVSAAVDAAAGLPTGSGGFRPPAGSLPAASPQIVAPAKEDVTFSASGLVQQQIAGLVQQRKAALNEDHVVAAGAGTAAAALSASASASAAAAAGPGSGSGYFAVPSMLSNAPAVGSVCVGSGPAGAFASAVTPSVASGQHGKLVLMGAAGGGTAFASGSANSGAVIIPGGGSGQGKLQSALLPTTTHPPQIIAVPQQQPSANGAAAGAGVANAGGGVKRQASGLSTEDGDGHVSKRLAPSLL